ncbi:hypothetical protein AVEN_256904-1 [Araneus ventricosus]|uniref:Uncharacterized protein n=1 Tax=Araneus ventricosus TaxID=182803 RepID=A0A4Y2CGC2_ARAVE|nr:hypothetical protein AVEN_256904-1 [Araneus ventricosus]
MNQEVWSRFSPDSESEEAQLVVPSDERKRVLEEFHDTPTIGHYIRYDARSGEFRISTQNSRFLSCLRPKIVFRHYFKTCCSPPKTWKTQKTIEL